MKKRSISGIIAIAMTCFTMNISADEIGIGFGINTSAYKSFDDNRAKYQKYNIPSPIEITFKKDLIGIDKLIGSGCWIVDVERSFNKNKYTVFR